MLSKFKESKTKALIPFLVTGYPSLVVTEKLVETFVKAGADIIELGVPFTDAMADGPVIQKASECAARLGIGLEQVLEFAANVKRKYPKLGLVLFTYYNPIFKMGLTAFAKKAKEAGIGAVLTVDLPPEEALLYRETLKNSKLGTIFLLSPTTCQRRLKIIDEASTEFIYYVSRVGVTGIQSELAIDLKSELRALRLKISKPFVCGFGISSGKQAREIAPFVEGVVVGSAFMKTVMDESDVTKMCEKVGLLAKEIKTAISNVEDFHGQ